jgi:hypothetical protein
MPGRQAYINMQRGRGLHKVLNLNVASDNKQPYNVVVIKTGSRGKHWPR